MDSTCISAFWGWLHQKVQLTCHGWDVGSCWLALSGKIHQLSGELKAQVRFKLDKSHFKWICFPVSVGLQEKAQSFKPEFLGVM